MKKILLPTDFSKNSLNAIHYAIAFFKAQKCEFYILNVQKASAFVSDDMMVVNSSTTIYKTLIDAAKKSISNLIKTIKTKYNNPNHEFFSIVDYDNFVDAINQVCNQHQIDLILMGTKGASGIVKVLFGSNTVHVMQRSQIPVLAIPDGYKYKEVSQIAFVTTNSKPFNIAPLAVLQKIVSIKSAVLNILHLADQNHLATNAHNNDAFFQAHFSQAKHDFIDTTRSDMLYLVHQYIENNNIDMLSIINKKHSFLERLFNIHPVERFAFKIEIPLLVMPYQ